jgi:hypothetical protein
MQYLGLFRFENHFSATEMTLRNISCAASGSGSTSTPTKDDQIAAARRLSLSSKVWFNYFVSIYVISQDISSFPFSFLLLKLTSSHMAADNIIPGIELERSWCDQCASCGMGDK